MVTVLGISFPYSYFADHEPSVCIIRDGKILAAIEEDRITRVKHSGFCPPYNAIMEVFKISGLSPKDIDAVAIPWLSPLKQYFLGLKESKIKNFLRRIASYPIYRRKEQEAKLLLKQLGVKAPIYWVEHHLSHAASTYFTSGFDEATIITLDGWGDGKSSVIYKAEGNELKEIASSKKASLGLFYLAATESIGFKPNDGEGKTMGFASYGNSKKLFPIFSKMIYLKNLEIRENYSPIFLDWKINLKDKSLFSGPRHTIVRENPFRKFRINYKKEDIAAGVQEVLEKIAVELVKRAVKKTGIKKVCLAGGVALNMKMNMAIRESGVVDELYIFPNPGDSGAPIGAALQTCAKIIKKKAKEMKRIGILNTYFGSGYSNENIEEAIKEYRLKYKKIKDPAKTAAELIAKGKVVGWFQGRSEYGPRALGNRSVLADPRDEKYKERINKYLKKRDWFMPFAPSMLEEHVTDYVENPTHARFMILGFKAKKGKKEEVPCAVHVDGTFRPQTVTKESNPLYYKLIKHFQKLTGIPLILNTSFNKHGIPMVRSPKDALDHVVGGNIEYLVIGNYLLDSKVNIKKAKASPEFS